MVQPSDSVGFWASDESITLRLEMLGGYELVIEKFGASRFRCPKRISFVGTPINQRPDQLQCPPLEIPVNKQKPQLINAF
jgi:hypothetical protein